MVDPGWGGIRASTWWVCEAEGGEMVDPGWG